MFTCTTHGPSMVPGWYNNTYTYDSVLFLFWEKWNIRKKYKEINIKTPDDDVDKSSFDKQLDFHSSP